MQPERPRGVADAAPLPDGFPISNVESTCANQQAADTAAARADLPADVRGAAGVGGPAAAAAGDAGGAESPGHAGRWNRLVRALGVDRVERRPCRVPECPRNGLRPADRAPVVVRLRPSPGQRACECLAAQLSGGSSDRVDGLPGRLQRAHTRALDKLPPALVAPIAVLIKPGDYAAFEGQSSYALLKHLMLRSGVW